MPVRVHEIRYGRADSPRFTRTFTDGFGDVVREERSGANGATLVTENAYDAFGRLVATAETAKPLVEYAYDTWGDRVAREESADDEWRLAETETASVVADDGEVWRVTTATRSCSDAAIAPLVTAQRTRLSGLTLATNAVTITTDVRGNETVTIATLDPASQSSYETTVAPGILNVATNWYTDGVMVSNISHSGVLSQTRRDALRREVAHIDGRGNVTHTVYDAYGRVAATIDALTNATTYAYDAMNRVAAITNALGHATVYEYDHRGNKTYEGGATYPVRYTYDVYGNKTTMTTYRHEPDGGAGRAALPATGDMATGGTTVGRGVLTAPPGDTTTWLYDEASGVMTNKVYADGKGTRYTYTDDGKLATRTWARGIVTTYAYDGWGNLTNTSYTDDTPTVTLFYDAMGRQVEACDAAGVTAFAYDAYGANTNETVIGVAGTNMIERFTDAYGRDAGYALNGARQTILGYDEQTGRLATMQTPSANALTSGSALLGDSSPDNSSFLIPNSSFTWTYLPGSDLKAQLVYPNGLTASWTYDANNQLLQVCNATPTNVISQYDYTYDAAGRRIACTRSGDAMSVADTIAYAYNARGELTNAVSDVNANYAYSYQYDDIGNRITSEECGVRSAEYVANELNQYTQIDTSNSAFPSETFNPEYDDDGNQTLIRTATGTWRVTYNGENRPVLWTCLSATGTIATNGDTIAMSYDRLGRRVTKNDERFVYDGYLQIADNSGNTYVWDFTENVATRPLAWLHCGSATYYMHDARKNVSEMVNLEGSNVAHYEYAPFGALTATSGTSVMENPWRFASEFAEDDARMIYYNNRHYDFVVGGWIARDLLNENATQRFLSLYIGFVCQLSAVEYIAYDNNPVDLYDMLGLFLPGKVSDWGGMGTGVKSKGNCWSYACNDRCMPGDNVKARCNPPGMVQVKNDDEAPYTCESLKNAIQSKYGQDGVGVILKSQDCGKCKYKVLAVIRPRTLYGPYKIMTKQDNFTAEWDVHFYRQDTDQKCNPTGTWSHKPGSGPVVHNVADPERDAVSRLYSVSCPFYFCLSCKSSETEESIDIDR